jgi:hypothetical protein
MPKGKKKAETVPLGSGLANAAKRAFLSRSAQVDRAVADAQRRKKK